MTETNPRRSDYPINPVFMERWSPRAFTGEPIGEADLMRLIEAARWAPSSYNSKPWRFLFARRDTPAWPKFLGLLNPFNQSWAQSASALLVLVSNSVMIPPGQDKPVPARSHSLDAGAAWMALALEAIHAGWFTHAMVGFDVDRAFTELDVPAGYRVETAIAIGRKADAAGLPDALRAREVPNDRLPLSAIAMEGGFRR
jgi:nitroreductase